MTEIEHEKTVKEQLLEKLKFWGLENSIVVEEEAQSMVLAALSTNDIISVYIDSENGLCINYEGDQ